MRQIQRSRQNSLSYCIYGQLNDIVFHILSKLRLLQTAMTHPTGQVEREFKKLQFKLGPIITFSRCDTRNLVTFIMKCILFLYFIPESRSFNQSSFFFPKSPISCLALQPMCTYVPSLSSPKFPETPHWEYSCSVRLFASLDTCVHVCTYFRSVLYPFSKLLGFVKIINKQIRAHTQMHIQIYVHISIYVCVSLYL